MGVKGLLSHITKEGDRCAEQVDLVQECKKRKSTIGTPVEIIMDFKAVRSELYQDFMAFISGEYGNHFLTLPAGEYEMMQFFLTNYFQQLKSMGLKLTWVMDFLYPSSETDTHDIKHHIWKERRVGYVESNKMLIANLKSGNQPLFSDHSPRLPLPTYWCTTLEDVTKKLRFEFIYPFGNETDYDRAMLVRKRNAFAVLTNDTEYVLFRDTPVILWKFFDLCKNLRFNSNECPSSLVCKVVRSSLLQRNLNLQSHDQLIDTMSLSGNLFTQPYVGSNELTKRLQIPWGFHKAAQFVRSNCSVGGALETCPKVSNVILRHKNSHELREAFSKARQYFNLEGDPSARPFSEIPNPIVQYLITPLSVKEICNSALEVAMGADWPSLPMQDLTIDYIGELQLPARQRMYGLLHKTNKGSMVQVYLRPNPVTLQTPVKAFKPIATGDGSTVEEIIEDNFDENMRRFVEIMAYYQNESAEHSLNNDLDEFLNVEKFETALLIYTFRLVIHINPSGNYFTREDFETLIVSTLSLYKEKYRSQIPRSMMEEIYRRAYPVSIKQLTTFAFFQDTLWLSWHVSRLLHLTHLVDHMRLITSLSLQLFVAFQEVCQKQSEESGSSSATLESRLMNVMKQVKEEEKMFIQLAMKTWNSK